jgi:hypothetical protein
MSVTATIEVRLPESLQWNSGVAMLPGGASIEVAAAGGVWTFDLTNDRGEHVRGSATSEAGAKLGAWSEYVRQHMDEWLAGRFHK